MIIRGLYHLIKCPLLIDNRLFAEEAFINLQISTEAAFHIIRERIRNSGISHPSISEVYDYIESHFTPNASWVDYLEEQYQKWIDTKHPASNVSYWVPSLFADDVMETYEVLISIYRHILIGEVGGSSEHQWYI